MCFKILWVKYHQIALTVYRSRQPDAGRDRGVLERGVLLYEPSFNSNHLLLLFPFFLQNWSNTAWDACSRRAVNSKKVIRELLLFLRVKFSDAPTQATFPVASHAHAQWTVGGTLRYVTSRGSATARHRTGHVTCCGAAADQRWVDNGPICFCTQIRCNFKIRGPHAMMFQTAGAKFISLIFAAHAEILCNWHLQFTSF